jgi:hypothetical protein
MGPWILLATTIVCGKLQAIEASFLYHRRALKHSRDLNPELLRVKKKHLFQKLRVDAAVKQSPPASTHMWEVFPRSRDAADGQCLFLRSTASYRLAFWCARRYSNAEPFAPEAERWSLFAPFILPTIVCLQQLMESALARSGIQMLPSRWVLIRSREEEETIEAS